MSDNPVVHGDSVGTVVSPTRVLGVTAGLAAASAVAGAFVANTVLAVALLLSNGPLAVFRDPFVYAIGGAVGAACGFFCGPLAAWTLLRKVPLGRAILEPSIAAAIGGGIGLLLIDTRGIWAPIGGAVAGLLLAAIRLRREYRNKTSP
jgi:hypothetical protein